MVEELSCGREEIEPERAFKRTSEQQVEDHRSECAVGQYFDGMLVKCSYRLNSRGRMVDLMEHHPEATDMTQAVPPVEQECAYKPADKSLLQGTGKSCQVEQRCARKK